MVTYLCGRFVCLGFVKHWLLGLGVPGANHLWVFFVINVKEHAVLVVSKLFAIVYDVCPIIIVVVVLKVTERFFFYWSGSSSSGLRLFRLGLWFWLRLGLWLG